MGCDVCAVSKLELQVDFITFLSCLKLEVLPCKYELRMLKPNMSFFDNRLGRPAALQALKVWQEQVRLTYLQELAFNYQGL